jgi:hypothetical protein
MLDVHTNLTLTTTVLNKTHYRPDDYTLTSYFVSEDCAAINFSCSLANFSRIIGIDHHFNLTVCQSLPPSPTFPFPFTAPLPSFSMCIVQFFVLAAFRDECLGETNRKATHFCPLVSMLISDAIGAGPHLVPRVP